MVLRHLRQSFAACGVANVAAGSLAVFAAGVCSTALAADPKYPAMDAGALLRQADQSRLSAQNQRALSKLTPLAPPMVLSEQQTLRVQDFKFEGVRLMPVQALQSAVAQFANRDLAQSDLDNLVSAVVEAYRQAGWVVRVYVPKQPLPTNSLTLQVLETIPPNTQK